MALKIYRDTPFNSGTEVDLTDVFTGDGSSTTFSLINKTGTRLGAAVQFAGTQFYQYSGGFTKSGNDFTLSSAPASNTQGVAPGQSNILFDQVYDTDTVEGVSNPRVQEVAFYFIDVDESHLYEYKNRSDLSGIQLCFVDNVSSYGAATSWCQLACSTGDAAGTAMTYGATAACLYTASMLAYGTMTASSAMGASSILVDTASTFTAGDYVMLGPGTAQQEIVRIASKNSTTLFISSTNYAHANASLVFTCGRKFWAKVTVPVGAAGGVATNFFDLSLRTRYVRKART